MNSGDTLTVDMHDTPAGFQVVINDLTTGQSGSMTASIANGFQQILYEPTAATCHQAPYAYPPDVLDLERAHAVPWAAHTYNVAFSDEIGHFEYCNAADENGNCTTPGTQDARRARRRRHRLLQRGRLAARADRRVHRADSDFDGASYGLNWPGTGTNNGQDAKYHPTPITFTSPLFNGNQNYSRIAFEADLPRIEAPDSGGICNRFTGENCVNPPPGAAFYPIYSTGHLDPEPERERPLRLAVRRYRDQGNDEHVRRELDRSVRAAALQLLPGPEPGDPAPCQQLPQHPRPQPLPGLAHGSTRGASSGTLPARYPERCRTTTGRAFDQSTWHGFSGRQSMPSGRAETFTQ